MDEDLTQLQERKMGSRNMSLNFTIAPCLNKVFSKPYSLLPLNFKRAFIIRTKSSVFCLQLP